MSNSASGADLPPRPRQLMVAAGVVIGGSAILVAAAFDAIGNLQSVDGRAQLQRAISSAPGRGLGVSLEQATTAMRVALSVTAVCAAIAVVLGIFVLQRHRGARVALTVVAVPLLVTAPLVGGFLGALVAVATLMLWNGPAGDWIAGRPVRTAADRAARDRQPPQSSYPPPAEQPPLQPPLPSPPGPPSTREISTAPAATEGFGTPAAESPIVPFAEPVPPPAFLPGRPMPPSGQRPRSVRVACVLTWVFSGIVALLYLGAIVALVVDRQTIVDRVVSSPTWRDAGLADDTLVPLLWFGVSLFLAWSLAAIALAWFTWRRHDWARYLLAASAGLTLLVGFVAFPIGLAHQVACGVTLGSLFSGQARAWFAGRPPPPPPGQAPGQPPGQSSGQPPDRSQDEPPVAPRRPW